MPVFQGTSGNDLLLGGLDRDTMNGLGGHDTIYGGGAEFSPTDLGDLISGGGGADQIYGNGGNDTINGDAGNDTIYTGLGIDVVNGGGGLDRLIINSGDQAYGGAGRDTFALEIMAEQGVGLNRAVIRDFTRQDTLDLSRMDAIVTNGAGDDAFTWVGLLPGAVALAAGQVGIYAQGADTIVRGFDGSSYFEVELNGYAAALVVRGDFIF